ncbi:MAG: vitamin K epoxide reductase family protein [Candidatus Micrarchaeia archaeon]
MNDSMKMRTSQKDFIILIVMSIIGIITSLSVVYELYVAHSLPPFCEIGNNTNGLQFNCAKVLLSSYSNISIFSFNISLDMLAVFWFIINIILVLLIVFANINIARFSFKLLFAWRFIGLAIVPYLVYLEFMVIHSICIYCTTMHIAIIIDFIIVTYFLFMPKSKIRSSLYLEVEPSTKSVAEVA